MGLFEVVEFSLGRITSFTIMPLKLASYLGLITASMALLLLPRPFYLVTLLEAILL